MTLAVTEFIAALADAMGWPRSRPPRVVLGDRASAVTAAAVCVNDAAIDELHEASTTVLLASAPGAGFARHGRRTHDMFLGGEGPAAEWARTERVVLDASELLAGGQGGLDDQLLYSLGKVAAAPLHTVPLDECKFVGYVPLDAAEQVREAVFAAGAGMIGGYTECSWSVQGTGGFRGGAGTNPTIGEPGKAEQVQELRMETVCRLHLRDVVVRAFVEAHPYEEPAYDVFPLLTASRVGLGRLVADLPDGESLAARLGEQAIHAEFHAPRTRAEGSVGAVTTGPLRPVLADVLREPGVTLVVTTDATPAERALLSERGIGLVVLDGGGVIRRFGDALASQIAGSTQTAVRLVAPLEFPGAAR